MNIATSVTLLRIFLTPIFLFVYLEHPLFGISSAGLPYVLLVLLGISELSDLGDGYLARRYNQVTDLGKVLDPMADSISRISVFLTFTQAPVNLPISLIFVFMCRDSVISTLRTVCALKGFTLAARTSGKIKAVVQAVAAFIVVGLMIPHSLGYLSASDLRMWSTLTVGVAAVYTVCSGIEYLYTNRKYVLKVLTTTQTKEAA